MEHESREHVISISLNEAEWQAFIRLHPQPVKWLRDKIQESIGLAAPMARASAAGAASTTSATIR